VLPQNFAVSVYDKDTRHLHRIGLRSLLHSLRHRGSNPFYKDLWMEDLPNISAPNVKMLMECSLRVANEPMGRRHLLTKRFRLLRRAHRNEDDIDIFQAAKLGHMITTKNAAQVPKEHQCEALTFIQAAKGNALSCGKQDLDVGSPHETIYEAPTIPVAISVCLEFLK